MWEFTYGSRPNSICMGCPIAVGGVSLAILDQNTIGVRFIDRSERRRNLLAELIAEIAEAAREPDAGLAGIVDQAGNHPAAGLPRNVDSPAPSDLLYKFSCSMSTIEWTPLPFRPNVKENRKCRRPALCHTWRDSPLTPGSLALPTGHSPSAHLLKVGAGAMAFLG
jgi:hypothetical protein